MMIVQDNFLEWSYGHHNHHIEFEDETSKPGVIHADCTSDSDSFHEEIYASDLMNSPDLDSAGTLQDASCSFTPPEFYNHQAGYLPITSQPVPLRSLPSSVSTHPPLECVDFVPQPQSLPRAQRRSKLRTIYCDEASCVWSTVGFDNAADLLRHMRGIHAKCLDCEYCGCNFQSATQLNAHQSYECGPKFDCF